jgi:hypothetical protein
MDNLINLLASLALGIFPAPETHLELSCGGGTVWIEIS